jgi:hypothetical protein
MSGMATVAGMLLMISVRCMVFCERAAAHLDRDDDSYSSSNECAAAADQPTAEIS